MALIKCMECGKEISDKAEACPNCGCPVPIMAKANSLSSESIGDDAVSKKKLKKGRRIKPRMFMVGAVVLFAIIISIFILLLPSKFNWGEVILNSVLPEPSSEYGSLYSNDADYLYLTVSRMSFFDYKNYVNSCIEKGFTYVIESSASFCRAFNGDGYELELDYSEYDEAVHITLNMRLSGTVKWSTNKLAALLPIPKSNVGSIANDYTYGYEVYIGKTPKAEFDTYILECEEKGFSLNVQKQDNAFFAENELGYELTIEYYECDIIYINISNPQQTEQETEHPNKDSNSSKETVNNAVPSTDTNNTDDKNTDVITTFVEGDHFTFHPNEFAERFDNSFNFINGYSFCSKLNYDDNKFYHEEDYYCFYNIQDENNNYNRVGMYSFTKPNGETAHILDAWVKGCASGVNILIDETEHVAPIVYATILAVDPGLSYYDEEALYNSIFDNIGNMEGVIKNSIRYVLYKDNKYHYLLISVATN